MVDVLVYESGMTKLVEGIQEHPHVHTDYKFTVWFDNEKAAWIAETKKEEVYVSVEADSPLNALIGLLFKLNERI